MLTWCCRQAAEGPHTQKRHKQRSLHLSLTLTAEVMKEVARQERGYKDGGESGGGGIVMVWWRGRSELPYMQEHTHLDRIECFEYWVEFRRKKDLSPNSIDAKWAQTLTPTSNDRPHGYTLLHIHMHSAKSNTVTKCLLDSKSEPPGTDTSQQTTIKISILRQKGTNFL